MKDIAMQMYSFGFDKPMTLAEQFKEAARMGYTGVELIRNYMDVPAETLKQQADEAGIAIVSAHVGMDYIINDLPYLAKLGMKMIICPGTPFATKEEALIVAAELNCIGKESRQIRHPRGLSQPHQRIL